jgi:TolB-like protein/class 3 adenylate cyclase
MTRKLAAILSADVKSYSRLMGEDEVATIRTLTAYREVMTALIPQHRGRVVDAVGDNLLAEFLSVVQAVECAVAIQQELQARNAELPAHRRMEFRIGINLGDVVVDGEHIYGDGVNIAARLESLAEGGGICIAGSVYEQIKTKLALGYEDMGAQAVKNIAEPVRVYRVRTEPGGADPPVIQRKPSAAKSRLQGGLVAVALLALLGGGVSVWQLVSQPLSPSRVIPAVQAPALPLPDKPSIAVLPFVNMSGDSEQEYFSDGMTEDLITELSRLAGLFVIARHSVYTYKGKAIKPDQVSQELRVRYVLEGSVRKANDRVRITAQLIDAMTGYHMWAQRYDRDLQDIFAVQEEIAWRITKELALRLTPEETEHMGQPYTNNVKAWEYFMQGAELYRRFTKEANAGARMLFLKAIAEDNNFARAFANLAGTYRQDWTFGWTEDLTDAENQARNNANEAVRFAEAEPEPKPSLPYALQQRAYVHMYALKHTEAIQDARRAVERDRNYADGYSAWALALIYSVDQNKTVVPDAIDKMEIAMRLNPKYPPTYPFHLGQAYYVKGDYQKAEEYLLEARGSNPNFRPARAYLVAVYIAQNRTAEARQEMTILQNMGRDKTLFTDPRRVAPYQDQAISKGLLDAWQQAGA